MKTRGPLIAALLLLSTVTAILPTPQSRGTGYTISGINYLSSGNAWTESTATLDSDFSRFSSDGIKHLSIRIISSVMAPSSPTTLSSTALTNIRKVLDEANNYGIKVQLDFWTQFTYTLGKASWISSYDTIFTTDKTEYINYMKTVVNAVKDKPAIEAYSIMNEPFFNGALTKSSAQAAFPDFYQAVKSQDPSRIVTCRFTLSYTPGSGRYDDSVYNMFDIFEITEYLDPGNPGDTRYNSNWGYWDTTIADLAALGKHLWVIEFGCSSDWATESQIATRYRLSLAKFDATTIVERAYAWAWQTVSGGGEKFNIYSGSVPRLAYYELTDYVTPPLPPEPPVPPISYIISKIGDISISDINTITEVSISDIAYISRCTATRTILLGASANDPTPTWDYQTTSKVATSINRFTTLVGKDIYIYGSWLAEWTGTFNWFMEAGDHSVLPLLQNGTIKAVSVFWGPYMNLTDTYTLPAIANGTYDTYITAQADVCKTFGYTIFMRFGAEMNICQGYPESSTWASSPTDFVAAWRHIYEIFRAEGADNVNWVWNPNFTTSPGAAHNTTEYYPGNAYVDWVGIDVYQYANSADPAADIDILYDIYGSSKPIAICEWATNSYEWTSSTTPDGTTATPSTQAYWMNKFFDAVEARPNIRMIIHFFEIYFQFGPDSSEQPHQVDTPNTAAEYAARVASPLYTTG